MRAPVMASTFASGAGATSTTSNPRQGIARALFSTLRDHCRTAPDTPRITVNSSPYAVGAYRRLGFRATGDERTVDGIRFTPMEYLFI